MILIRPEKEETVYTRVFLKNERLQDSKTAEQFLMAYGLNGMVVDSGFLMSTARMLLLIFPGIVLGALFLKRQTRREGFAGGEGRPVDVDRSQRPDCGSSRSAALEKT